MILYLYKFYSWSNSHSLENIKESKFYFSDPSVSFEDDFDCAILGFDGTRVFPKIRVACFSKRPNEFMWEHYASNGNGVCLQYIVNDLRVIGEILPIKYVSSVKLRSMHNDFRVKLLSGDYTKTFMAKYLREILITKDEKYSEENEYRIIVKTDQEYYRGIKPKLIIVGDKTSHDIKEEIEQFCIDNSIPLISKN